MTILRGTLYSVKPSGYLLFIASAWSPRIPIHPNLYDTRCLLCLFVACRAVPFLFQYNAVILICTNILIVHFFFVRLDIFLRVCKKIILVYCAFI